MMNIIEVPNTGIGEYVSQNQERLRGSNIMYLYASSIEEARLSDHSREYSGNFNDLPSGTVIELLERPRLYSYLVKQGDGLWRDIKNWSDIGSDEIPKVYNANAITIIYNPAQNMSDQDSAAREADMNQELKELITQYAEIKHKLDRPLAEDGFLILSQLAEYIADIYEGLPGKVSESADKRASCWRDISDRYLSLAVTDPELEQRLKRAVQNISRVTP